MNARGTASQNVKASVDWPITLFSVAAVFAFVACMALRPDQTLAFVRLVFDQTTRVMGVPILLFTFLGLFLCLYYACGRHGDTRLGEGKPEYSLFSYAAMMICAALASTAVFYSFIEWSYYLKDPAFGLTPNSPEAAELALPYAFFHWGLSVQVIFVLTAVAMAYAVYVKKVPNLRVSAICEAMMGDFRYKRAIGKVIDLITIFSIVGGLGVSLGLGVPLISAGIARIFGLEVTFALNVATVLAISALFSLSSFVGLERGMRLLSDATIYLAILFIGYILLVGPSEFIVKLFGNSLGLMLSNYVKMSLWTDPIKNSGFPEANTIFLFTLALNYAALMGIFITKISKGRTIRELVLTCLIGLSVGTWIMFAVNSGYAMNAELTGVYKLSEAANGQAGVFTLLDTLPGGIFIPIAFTITAIGFLATSLDSAAFTLSAVATAKLDERGNTHPLYRLFWCIVLALVPLSIMFAEAPFSALKTLCIFLSVPFLFVIIYLNIGLFRWFGKNAR
jgi:BCCT family betaine/carnitine transporter